LTAALRQLTKRGNQMKLGLPAVKNKKFSKSTSSLFATAAVARPPGRLNCAGATS